MDDDDIRAILAAAIERNTGAGGNGTVLRLARIGQELMRQRDARSEDFYAANQRAVDAEAKLAKVRAEVAEEIAQATEAQVDDEYELSNGLRVAAQIARNHAKGQ